MTRKSRASRQRKESEMKENKNLQTFVKHACSLTTDSRAGNGLSVQGNEVEAGGEREGKNDAGAQSGKM